MIPGFPASRRQWSRTGHRKHSVFPDPVPVATTVERPTSLRSRSIAVRWCRYGVNPSGISGNGSPPSAARWNGSATERYGPLIRFSGVPRNPSTTPLSAAFDGPNPVRRKSESAVTTSPATADGIS